MCPQDAAQAHRAALDGDLATFSRLLRRSPSFARVRNRFGWTPLHTAAYSLKTDCCALLLAHGCEINARDSRGNSPLSLARQIDPGSAVVKLLEKYGGTA